MSSRISAGILLYRVRAGRLEVLLGHPGGPWARTKDAGHWSIPKGEVDDEAEDLLAVARREFAEETCHPVPQGALIALGETRQKGGKLVPAWGGGGGPGPAGAGGHPAERGGP